MYALGIDLGTTFTAAGTWRDGRVEIASLGSHGAVIPSVVLLREDETFLTGETASRRAYSEPERVAREFKRRLGDTTPILLGGAPYSAEALMARMLHWVVDEVSSREGGEPSTICVCHPANWGPYKMDLLRQAVRIANLEQPVIFTTEPEAAAVFYAHGRPVPPGALVAVYDLGGGTFDAAVLRKTDSGFAILGQPEGIERLGGIDFDAAVFAHVNRALGGKLAELDESDPATIAAVARLREDCVGAKEALSEDTDVAIPVLLPNLATQVRLTRAELEAMVRPALYESIAALRRALRSAGVTPDQLHAVLLVGGSSRMPVIAQLVGAELGRPVAVDAHPKHAVALGAAWVASGSADVAREMRAAPRPPTAMPVPPAVPTIPQPLPPQPAAPPQAVPPQVVSHEAAQPAPPQPTPPQPTPRQPTSPRPVGPQQVPPQPITPQPAGRQHVPGHPPVRGPVGEDATMLMHGRAAAGPQSRSRTPLFVAGGVLAAVAIAAGAVLLASGDDADGDPGGGTAATTPAQQTGGATTPAEQTGEPTALPADEQCTDEIMSNERWVCLTSATVADGQIVIEYDAEFAGSTPDIDGGFHLHIYGADDTGTEPPDEIMGTHAANPGNWYIEDRNPSVVSVDSDIFQENIGDAPKVCARIANGDHELVPDANGGFKTGNCVPIDRG